MFGVECAAADKRKIRGGFKNKIVLEEVNENR
jgi:hypothetical protein